MEILKPGYKWARALTERDVTTHLILHHAAGNGSPEGIHAGHIARGWAGIAYHFYVRKDGSVYEGRPINMIGGHTANWNWCSVGVCFEGNFETESMPEAQVNSGRELVSYIRSLYPNISIGKHRDYGATACPGAKFPFDELVSGAASDEPSNTDAEAGDEPSGWAVEACNWAMEKGIFRGDGKGAFRWHENITREEAAVVLHRLYRILTK